jgi:hypothetical protein
MITKAGRNINRKKRLDNLMGRGDGKDPLPEDYFDKMFGLDP